MCCVWLNKSLILLNTTEWLLSKCNHSLCILMRLILIKNRMTFLGWPGFIIAPSCGGGRALCWLDIYTNKRCSRVLLKVCPDTETHPDGVCGWLKCDYFRGRKLGCTTEVLIPAGGSTSVQPWYRLSLCPVGSIRSAQTPGARSPGRLNFVRWHLMFVGLQYGTSLMSLFWCLEYWGGS
jgi:hypothetical protein